MNAQRWSDALASLDHGSDLSTVSRELGIEASTLSQLQLAVRVLEHRSQARWRRRARVAATVALSSIVVSSLAALPVLAQANCTQTLPSPLVTLCANTPALASDMNGNLQQLVTWVQQKVGTVGSANITTSGSLSAGSITTTGAVTAGSISTSGDITATGTATLGRVTVSNGIIQGTGTAVTGTADLGLYQRSTGAWMRFVNNNAPFRFFSTTGTTGIGGTNVLSVETNGALLTTNGEPENTALLPQRFCVIVPRNETCPGNWDAREIKFDTEDDSNADQGKDGVISWDDGNSASVRIRFCCRAW